MSTPLRLVLASASPRRRELLAQAGYAFDVHVADVDESRYEGELPQDYVRRLALKKVRAVADSQPDAIVLGADTTVVCESKVLNKPRDLDEAERMLRLLSGRVHQVHTGLAVILGERAASLVETTYVTFREIREPELRNYLASGDPLDKAGAYGIQGYAARWIPRIEGDYFNVVGLPIAAVVKLINSLG
ncbi:MAG TPA: Maf family protein [Acidobacteriaceae bacterium]